MEIVMTGLEHRDNFLVGVETRVKIIAVFCLIVVSTSLKILPTLGAGVCLTLGLLMWARVPLRQYTKRILWVLPFAGTMLLLMPFVTPGNEAASLSLFTMKVSVSQEGINKALMYSGRVLISVLALSFLTLTTGLNDLLSGLRRIGLPGVMVNLLAFTIRYFAVLGDEMQRMRVARKSRGFTAGTNLLDWQTIRTLSELIGVLFIRSYERGDRVFSAMLSRGYTGEIGCCGHCSPTVKDWCWGAALVLLSLGLKTLELGGLV